MTLPAWDKITTSEEWKKLSDKDKRTVYQGYLSDLGDTDAWKSLGQQEKLTVVDAIMKDAGFNAPVEDVTAIDKTGFVKNITDFYGGVKDKLVTGATNIFNKAKTGLKPVSTGIPGEMSVEEISRMTEAGLDVNNMPLQDKESIVVPIMDTLKAIPPVVTAVAGPMAAMPGAGIEAAAQLLPRISADPDKLIDLGSLEDAQAVLDKRLGAFSEFITTPEQAQAVENIGLASKPFEMAGEGWRLIGAGINNVLKDPNVDPNIDPIPILEPFLASLGEISAVMGLPEILKKLKAMPPEQRALVTKEIADTVASEGLTEAELLRKLGPNSDLWKAKIRQQQEAARAYAGEAESSKLKAESEMQSAEGMMQSVKKTGAPAAAVPPAPAEGTAPFVVKGQGAESIAQGVKQTELTNKADLVKKPAPAIPEFKDSEEATAFGMKASPEEIARIKELQVEFDATARQLVGSGNTKDGQVVGQMASYMREAIEANANPGKFAEDLKRGEERKTETAGLSVNEAMAKELERLKKQKSEAGSQKSEDVAQSAKRIEQSVGKPVPMKEVESSKVEAEGKEPWNYLDSTHPDAIMYSKGAFGGNFYGGENLTKQQKKEYHSLWIDRLNKELKFVRGTEVQNKGIKWANKNAQQFKNKEVNSLLERRKAHEEELIKLNKPTWTEEMAQLSEKKESEINKKPIPVKGGEQPWSETEKRTVEVGKEGDSRLQIQDSKLEEKKPASAEAMAGKPIPGIEVRSQKSEVTAQSAEGIEQGVEKKPIPMKEAESSKVKAEDKNKIVVPPFTKYSLIGTAYNAASLRPAVGKKFSQEEIDILKNWLQEQGYSVGSANANKIDVNNPTGKKLNLIDGFQYNRDQKIRESRKQQDKEYEERQSIKQQEFEALPSSAWIKDIFGENVANASLRLALARYLDGLDKKYTGIGHVTFLPGLEKLGLNSEKHEMADIKSKYLEWKDTTTEKKPVPLKSDYIKAEEVKKDEPITKRSGSEGTPEDGGAGAGGKESGVVPGTEKTVEAEGVREGSGKPDLESVRTGVEQGDRTPGPEQGEKPAKKGKKDRDRADKPVERDSGNVPEFQIKGDNYVIPEGGLERTGGWKTAAKTNLDAIELYKKITSENRPATPEEQKTLSMYVGWGASELANNMFPGFAYYRTIYPNMAKDEWKPLVERLQKALTEEEVKTAARSTQYAHYTSEGVIRSIYKAFERFGFKGGKILEPGTGIGNFVGLIPESMRKNTLYTGIEMDKISAGIAKLLYPGHNIIEGDFTKTLFPRDFFDAAIGNPPFGQTKILADPEYKANSFSLHNYFFAKSIDRVRPGGVLAFVTSRYTMDAVKDKARKYLADRADLIGAIRLPQTAFLKNAGTEVVTDIIFLKKRVKGEAPAGQNWMGLKEIETPEGKVNINEFFVDHPEMVLGKNSLQGSMYTDKQYTVLPPEGNIEELFRKAVDALPENVYSKVTEIKEAAEKRTFERDYNPENKKEGGLYISKSGDVHIVDFGSGVAIDAVYPKVSAKEKSWLKDYIGLRDAVKKNHYDQLTDGDWEKSLEALKKAYKGFVKKNGRILEYTTTTRTITDEDGNTQELVYKKFNNDKLLRMDAEGSIVTALEGITENGDIFESPALSERTIKPPVTPKIETVPDALAVSLNEKGTLDIDHVAELAKIGRDDVIESLGDLVFKAPSGEYVLADEYLSGNVVKKLAEAEAAAKIEPEFKRNVEALTKVQPAPLTNKDITVSPGATWIPLKYLNSFGEEVLDLKDCDVRYIPATNTWTVEGKFRPQGKRGAGLEWGTEDRGANELFESALNNRAVKITRTVKSEGVTKTFTDDAATTAANEVIKKIKEKFGSWIWQDADRAGDVLSIYNRQFNNLAPRNFDGSHLTLPGVSSLIELYPHQKRAIWRIIQSGNVYLAHAVGSGKTFEMIAAGMEMKRLGLISKPLYVIPKHMLGQFAREFVELYPMANVMVADEQNFHTENRRRFVAQATLNNPDAIVVPHSSFGLFSLKKETIEPVREYFINQMREALENMEDDDVPRHLIKQMEQRIEQTEQRFDSMIASGDKAVTFEEMGVDYLFVDEAHEFRKLDYVTNQKIKGIDPVGSKKAMDLYIKTLWLETQNPGRSHTFASGTPITNTLGELYTVMRFFDPKGMEEDGIDFFDAWASNFARSAVGYEMNAAGNYQPVERFSKFINIPELMSRVRQFMDVLTLSQLSTRVKLPEIAGGKPEVVITEPIPELQNYQEKVLAPRIKTSMDWKPSRDQPGNPDPLINIITDGRLASIDVRFVQSVVNNPKSKLNKFIDDLIEAFNQTKNNQYLENDGTVSKVKGSTIVAFYNHGFGEAVAKNRGLDARKWVMDRLKKAKIPSEQVAWIEDYDTASKREALFKELRNGKKRVLFGSAKKMGTGMNIQNRLHTLLYLDPPWYPADVEQPMGRIVRQGNQNEKVYAKWYAAKGSYDSTMWQLVSTKSKFIEKAFLGEKDLRSMDDLSEASQYEMASALASGDERIIKVVALKAQVEKYDNLYREWSTGKNTLSRNIRAKEEDIFKHKIQIKRLEVIKKQLPEGYQDFENGVIDNKTYDKYGEFEEALQKKIASATKKDFEGVREIKIGKINNIDLYHEVFKRVKADNGEETIYTDVALRFAKDVQQEWAANDVSVGKIMRFLRDIDSKLSNYDRQVKESEQDIKEYEKRLKAPFEYEREKNEAIAELSRLEQALAEEDTAKTMETQAFSEMSLDEANKARIKLKDSLLKDMAIVVSKSDEKVQKGASLILKDENIDYVYVSQVYERALQVLQREYEPDTINSVMDKLEHLNEIYLVKESYLDYSKIIGEYPDFGESSVGKLFNKGSRVRGFEGSREISSDETTASKSKPIPGVKKSSAGGGSASYGGDPDVGGYATNIKYVLELPELVRLARDLMDGKYPQIKKNLGKYAGMFYHSGKIVIKADVFRDEKQVAAVLAHEIGHLVDWLPDKDMKKGNILGRIASLHNYLKKTLPQYPGAPDELTTQDRSRLRYQAQKMAKAQSENEWIDEIIKKELPIEPQDVLNIWNAVDVARAINPELYEYVARLSTAQKKAVVKDALQGVVRDELKQFAKVIEENTGKQIKQELSEEEFKKLVSQKYKDLINEEIKKRRLFDYEKIMDELKELTRIWKPFDPVLDPAFTKFRYSAKELYADAFSALLNAPGFLKAAAPNFYEALFNYMENKPEVKRHYEDLQAKIASGEIESERIEEVYKMFKKGDEAYALSLDKESRFYDAVMRDFVDLAHMVLKKVRKVGERNIPAAENPRYKIEEMNYSGSEIEWLLTRVKTEIMKPLDKASLTWDDFGVELYLRRVKGDRSGIANPQGWTARLAEKKLEELKKLRTAKQNTGMEDAIKAFQDLRTYVIDKAEKTGRWDDEIIKMMRNDMDYATFDVIKYIEKRYGAGPSAKIYPQVGTFNEISNPATATIMKDISILKAINRGVAAESVTKFFKMHFPNEIKPAETKWNGKFQEIQPPDRGSGQGLIVYLKNGKPEGYYVDEWVADIFEKNPIEGHVISKVLGWLAQPFRAVFTEYNPGFALFNVIKDYKRSVKNVKGGSLLNFAKYYLKAIKPSFKSVYGIPDSVVDEMLKGNMLISIADFRGQVSEDKQIERMLKMYHLEKRRWNNRIVRPFGYLFHYLSNINKAIERIPKVAGYQFLKGKYPDLPDEVIGHMVRVRVGSPAFLNRGRWYPIYNNSFLFSNATKEGYRGDYESMASNPGAWWWKTAKYVFLPKLLMMAGSVGLLGAAVKVIMDGISDYDKANFITVPLGLTPSGKSVILRIPTDEMGRLMGGILWKATGMQKKDTITDLLDYMAGQVPTINPAIENLAAVVQYASGKNPYDSFYGSYAIPEQIFEAGGSRSHKAFLKWMLNNSGAGIVYRFKNDDVDSVKGELEEILGYPVASNIIGRFIKVTDRGLKETIEADKQMLKKLQAQENLAVKDALAKSFRDEELTDEEIQLILNKITESPEMIDRNMQTMWSRKYGQMYIEEFVTAQTNEQKAAVIYRMLERDNLLEKVGIELKPIPMKENK